MTRIPKTVVEISIPSQLGYEKIVRALIASLAAGIGFTSERVADIQTAVSEACINAIEHGNLNRADLRITVICTISTRRLEVVICDRGLKHAPMPEPTPATIEQKLSGLARPRGMGLMLIHELVDESGFLPQRRGKGNRFRMTLYRQQGQRRRARAAQLQA